VAQRSSQSLLMSRPIAAARRSAVSTCAVAVAEESDKWGHQPESSGPMTRPHGRKVAGILVEARAESQTSKIKNQTSSIYIIGIASTATRPGRFPPELQTPRASTWPPAPDATA
jgi:hypothetical protein